MKIRRNGGGGGGVVWGEAGITLATVTLPPCKQDLKIRRTIDRLLHFLMLIHFNISYVVNNANISDLSSVVLKCYRYSNRLNSFAF